jgi:hypothetical protein
VGFKRLKAQQKLAEEENGQGMLTHWSTILREPFAKALNRLNGVSNSLMNGLKMNGNAAANHVENQKVQGIFHIKKII